MSLKHNVLFQCVKELSIKYSFNLKEACELLEQNESKLIVKEITTEWNKEEIMNTDYESIVNDMFEELITQTEPTNYNAEKKIRVKLTEDQKEMLAQERQDKKYKKEQERVLLKKMEKQAKAKANAKANANTNNNTSSVSVL